MHFALAFAVAAAAPAAADVRTALGHFLTAFENLDWDAFRDSFEDGASAFFPAPETPERADGKAAIETRFRKVFDAIRAGAKGGPPYHRLEPEDLVIQLLGTDVALASFHLRNDKRLARRTIVFRRRAEGWRIAHLHPSNVLR